MEKNCASNLFAKFLSIYWGWVDAFIFADLLYYFNGNTPLIFVIFSNITNKTFFIKVAYSLIHVCLCFITAFFLFENYHLMIFYYSIIWFVNTFIMQDNFISISNNIKELRAFEKRLKLFEYLKNGIGNKGSSFFTWMN